MLLQQMSNGPDAFTRIDGSEPDDGHEGGHEMDTKPILCLRLGIFGEAVRPNYDGSDIRNCVPLLAFSARKRLHCAAARP